MATANADFMAALRDLIKANSLPSEVPNFFPMVSLIWRSVIC